MAALELKNTIAMGSLRRSPAVRFMGFDMSTVLSKTAAHGGCTRRSLNLIILGMTPRNGKKRTRIWLEGNIRRCMPMVQHVRSFITQKDNYLKRSIRMGSVRSMDILAVEIWSAWF